ncbi:trigger factor [Mycolicibacterium neoaurum]|uniref:HNH endonuclease n=1 Tax=Mycolicibacterium neoaurum TaxID=1795 RepID=UPI000691264B|nr:HNH endonuclease signature motif containing protein [Mycolicibacterium neoaurum]SDD36038.1 trigger factor [Mycolicibacterium neoaurum]
MNQARPPIPDPMKREVRQRCGFGCVICGHPIYEYEHMDDYAAVQTHESDNLTLLCDGHHRLKTSGLLPIEVVRRADAHPHNRRQSASTPFNLFYTGSEASVLVGSVETRTERRDVAAIVIDGHPIIGYRFEDEQCLLQMNLYDETNELVLQVCDNELVYATTRWDIEFVGSTLTVRNGLGDIYIEIRFRVPRQVYIPRGRIFYNNVELEIWPECLTIVNNAVTLGKVTVLGCQAALVIGERGQTPLSAAVGIEGVPRDYDREEARASARKQRREVIEARNSELGNVWSHDSDVSQ